MGDNQVASTPNFVIFNPVVSGVVPNTGAAGTLVTISGSGFSGAAAGVSFGGVPASSFTVVSDTRITATAPVQPSGGVKDVVVTVGPVSSKTSSADQFTYPSSYNLYTCDFLAVHTNTGFTSSTCDPTNNVSGNSSGAVADTPISLANGFGYGGGPTPGIFNQECFTIVNTNFTFLAWKFTIQITGEFFAGYAGPGWATGSKFNQLYVETGANGDISLGVALPYTEAGFLIGVFLTLSLYFNISQYYVTVVYDGWDSHIETGWKYVSQFRTQIPIDILQVLLAVIAKFVKNGQKQSTFQKTNIAAFRTGFPWKMTDSTTTPVLGTGDTGTDCAVTGEVNAVGIVGVACLGPTVTTTTTDLNPGMNFRINLVPYIPEIGQFIDKLSAVGVTIQAGPTIGLTWPIHIKVTGVVLDGTVYPVTGTHMVNDVPYTDSAGNQSSQDYKFYDCASSTGTPGFDQNYVPGSAGLQYTWSWGIDFVIGVFASFTAWGVANVTIEIDIALLAALGINSTIQTGITGNVTGSFIPRGIVSQIPQLAHVIFEHPDDLPA